jgi:hypothetical protein
LAGGPDAAIEAPAPAAVGNSWLAQLHAERMARQGQRQQGQAQGPPSGNGQAASQKQGPGQGPGLQQGLAQLSLLSYNVWFQDVCMQSRMAAIGSIIQDRQPDFVCLQVGRQGHWCEQSVSCHHLCRLTCAGSLCATRLSGCLLPADCKAIHRTVGCPCCRR